jgi:hypothetical protein
VSGAPGAPTLTGNIALDGRELAQLPPQRWSACPRSRAAAVIDTAAQNHSDYQRINNVITHDEVASNQGFTGVDTCGTTGCRRPATCSTRAPRARMAK